MLYAVRNHKNMRSGNTVVTNDETGVEVYLHGNCIYAVCDGAARFTLAGWNTPTTRSRLNALGVGVYQKGWQAMRNGQAINSREWYTVD